MQSYFEGGGGGGRLTCIVIYLSLCCQASASSVSIIGLHIIREESLGTFQGIGSRMLNILGKTEVLCVTKTRSGHLKRKISALPSGQQKKNF
jgi:hypothetical protein